MMVALILALCLQQDANIARLVEDLSDDSLEVRERAQAELLRIGAPAFPHLKRAAAGADRERRARAAALLRHDVFLAVPEVIEANILDLASEDWHAALRKVVAAGDKAVAPLRAAAKAKDKRLAFRAGQLADILEIKPIHGLRWGVVVEEPELTLSDQGGFTWAIAAGVEVFINASSKPITVETGVDGSAAVAGIACCSSIG